MGEVGNMSANDDLHNCKRDVLAKKPWKVFSETERRVGRDAPRSGAYSSAVLYSVSGFFQGTPGEYETS